jgi:gliding motility-associated-like protein
MKKLQPGLIALFTCFTVMVQAQINLTNGLLLYFPFTGNATDVSGNTNVATVNGPVLANDRFGAANSAYYFDGVDDYISIVNGAGMKPTYPFSFSCWFNPVSSNTAVDVNFIYANDYTIPGDDYYGAIFNTPLDRFQASVGDGNFVDPSNRNSKMINQTLVYGQWHHLAAVVYSATNMRLFIDCAEVPGAYSGTGSGLTFSPNNTGIMGRGNGGVGENFLNAYVDEVRFYNRALSDQEIGALYYWPVYPPALLYQLPTDSLTIQCGSTVNIDGTAQGIISYDWDDNTSGPTKTFTTAGTYILTVSDGCFTGYDTLVVTDTQGEPTLTLTAPPNGCVGSATTITAAGAANYTWSPATGLNTTTGPVVTASIVDTVTYTVIGTNACGDDTATVTINAVTQFQPAFSYAVDECSGLTTTTNLGPLTGDYLWVWDNGDTSTTYSPQISFMSAGQHNVFLISNPGTACADTLRQVITTAAGEKELVYMPNSFTPNGDGINDYFKVFTAQTCLEGELYIFDNWGEEVFYTDKAFTTFWNGSYKSKKATNTVFAYRLILNTGKEYYGKVVLVR